MIKKIFGLSIVTLLVIALIFGGVWAFYSDIEAGSGNVLTAGTFDLIPLTEGTGPSGKYSVDPGGNGDNGNVTFQKLQSGDAGTITWVLSNNGTLPGTLAISSATAFTENGSNEIETVIAGNNGGDNGDLDQYMGVTLQRGAGSDQAGATANLTYILGSSGSFVPLSNLQASLNSAGIGIAANSGNDTLVYKLSWEIGSLFSGVNPNIIQSDNTQIDVTFTITP